MESNGCMGINLDSLLCVRLVPRPPNLCWKVSFFHEMETVGVSNKIGLKHGLGRNKKFRDYTSSRETIVEDGERFVLFWCEVVWVSHGLLNETELSGAGFICYVAPKILGDRGTSVIDLCLFSPFMDNAPSFLEILILTCSMANHRPRKSGFNFSKCPKTYYSINSQFW